MNSPKSRVLIVNDEAGIRIVLVSVGRIAGESGLAGLLPKYRARLPREYEFRRASPACVSWGEATRL